MNEPFKKRRARIGMLTLVLAGLFVLAAIRLAIVALIDGPRLASIARTEHTETITLAPVRGPIVDRNGEPLALSAQARSVFARPRRLLESSTAAERAPLAAAVGITPAELEVRLARPVPFVWLGRHLAPEQAHAAEDLGLESVGAVSEYKRFYPESNLAGSVVGLAGTDGQGLSGVELQYDRMVRGAPVELQIYHDALGHQILDSPLALKNAEPGARLELTIDASIQSAAENYLAGEVAQSGARRGAAVVLDPFTGEVLALANVNGAAAGGAADDRLHDTAVQDAFEPGSTMKGLLGAIVIQDHAIAPDRQIFCENGEWHLAGRTIHDDDRHGWLDLGGIIEVSSNIGAAKIALALGADRFYDGLTAFGLGRRTGIDLPGEASGLLRAPDKWRTIELADHGFGQGVAVTPMQLAVAYAAIANGGVVMRPYVVRAAYDADGHELLRHTPQVLRRVVAPEVAHRINLLLRNVVNGPDGTGHLARVADFTVAGKTGTAQMVNPATGGYFQTRLVASFVGFVPADDPRLVILVVLYDVSHGHFGGLFAAPVFSQIASAALARLDIAPAEAPASYDTASMIPFGGGGDGSAPQAMNGVERRGSDEPGDGSPAEYSVAPSSAGAAPEMATGRAPDFRGESLRSAFAIARGRGLAIDARGDGYVVGQSPPPGAPITSAPIALTLADLSAAGIPSASAERSASAEPPTRHRSAAHIWRASAVRAVAHPRRRR